MKLLRMLRLIFKPFASIARSLDKIATLYELELGERNPPIMIRSETPNPQVDTEVLSEGMYDQEPVWKRILAFQNPEEKDYPSDED